MRPGRKLRWSIAVAVVAIAGAQGCATTRRPGRSAEVPHGWPVARQVAVVSSEFGPRRGGARHEGIDFSAPQGSPVTATAGGVVAFAERAAGYGRTVVIDHGGGWQTRYAHLKKIRVRRGDRVRGGEAIGTVGSSGAASAPHLHYEVLRHGSPVDPRPYLDR